MMDSLNAICVIDRRISGDHLFERPSKSMIEAVQSALPVMIECKEKLGWPIDQQITIIDYHARHEDAEYSDDQYTMSALKVAVRALLWKAGYCSKYEPM